MVTPAVLVGALLVVSPSLWRAGHGQLGLDATLVHFLLAVGFVAVARMLLRTLVGSYVQPALSAAPPPRRRRGDLEPDPAPGIPVREQAR